VCKNHECVCKNDGIQETVINIFEYVMRACEFACVCERESERVSERERERERERESVCV